jgi:DNA-binding transcriptional MerR regulator
MSKGLLKPLGNPPQNATRYFSSSEIERLRIDTKWLDKASGILIKHWKMKNEKRPKKEANKPNSITTTAIGHDVAKC